MYVYITGPCIAATTLLRPWLKSPKTPQLTRLSGMARCVCRYEEGVRKSHAFYCTVSYVYSHTLYTLAHPAWRTVYVGVRRVTESRMYSTAWCRVCIRTPYTPPFIRHGALCVQAWEGCQKVSYILPHGVVCIFSHLTQPVSAGTFVARAVEPVSQLCAGVWSPSATQLVDR